MKNILLQNQIEYLESLRPVPDELIKEMEEFAREKKVPILDWKSAEFLELLISIQKPTAVLEIGTAIAYSSIRIARRLKNGASLDTIEKSTDNITLAKNFINRAGLSSTINILQGDALSIMPALEKEYDFIFLDADKQDYEKLFYYSLNLLKRGGVLFVDNLLWHGYAAMGEVPEGYKNSAKIIRDFNKMFTSEISLETSILPVGDGIGLGIKK